MIYYMHCIIIFDKFRRSLRLTIVSKSIPQMSKKTVEFLGYLTFQK